MQNDEMPEIGTDHIAEGVGNAKKFRLSKISNPDHKMKAKSQKKEKTIRTIKLMTVNLISEDDLKSIIKRWQHQSMK